MALAMKDACERCATPLPLTSADARICSYECTFCAECATAMDERCPNLRRRARRAAAPGSHAKRRRFKAVIAMDASA